jgi:hypothetical protein
MSDFAISAATASNAPILLHHRRAMFVDMGRDEDAIELMAHAAAAYFRTALADGSLQRHSYSLGQPATESS